MLANDFLRFSLKFSVLLSFCDLSRQLYKLIQHAARRFLAFWQHGSFINLVDMGKIARNYLLVNNYLASNDGDKNVSW